MTVKVGGTLQAKNSKMTRQANVFGVKGFMLLWVKLQVSPARSTFWEAIRATLRYSGFWTGKYLLFDPGYSGWMNSCLAYGNNQVQNDKCLNCVFMLKDVEIENRGRHLKHLGGCQPYPENCYNVYANWLIFSVRSYYENDTSIK